MIDTISIKTMKNNNTPLNKTKVDDMLIEMITPKIKEIEENFSKGKGLEQGDINTLLLKSQYHRIRHLDLKFNEFAADVASLKADFAGLRGEFAGFKGEFTGLRGEFAGFKGEFEVIIQKALNKNMMTLIAVIGAFFTLSKIIDKF